MSRKSSDHRRGPGFSLIEIALGVIVFTMVSGIVWTIYSKSNTYAAKGTWRVQTAAKQRLALRQVKDFLEKSSYPSAIRVDNYIEDPSYQMQLGAGGSLSGTAATSGATVGMSVYEFKTVGPILDFSASTPDQDFGGLKVAGISNHVVLSLETKGSTSSAMQLVATSDAFKVELAGGKLSVASTPFKKQRIVLLEDVAEIDVGISGLASTKEKTLVEFCVLTKDPYDGKLRLRETAKAVVNVIAKKAGS
ncbi:MAG: hypothetical protein HY303_02730 [Candidatus Wallbacteria bacterium]|nr:hypothetical protein [Candidatus Wallbacteria bacterium]